MAGRGNMSVQDVVTWDMANGPDESVVMVNGIRRAWNVNCEKCGGTGKVEGHYIELYDTSFKMGRVYIDRCLNYQYARKRHDCGHKNDCVDYTHDHYSEICFECHSRDTAAEAIKTAKVFAKWYHVGMPSDVSKAWMFDGWYIRQPKDYSELMIIYRDNWRAAYLAAGGPDSGKLREEIRREEEQARAVVREKEVRARGEKLKRVRKGVRA
jgi:hypothetical protein